jgi:hypothetical protein
MLLKRAHTCHCESKNVPEEYEHARLVGEGFSALYFSFAADYHGQCGSEVESHVMTLHSILSNKGNVVKTTVFVQTEGASGFTTATTSPK